MNIFKISIKNLFRNRLTTMLNIILVAFGVGILSILFLASNQIGNKLEKNAKDIDLVVGAKGSPLQLILSSIYHIDYPTGNIPATDAYKLMRNPMVKRAVPLALAIITMVTALLERIRLSLTFMVCPFKEGSFGPKI
jgi:putative ABC transport system permease protein